MAAAQFPIPPFANVEPLAMPLAIPSGSERWEATVRLPDAEVETARIACQIRAPARIVQIIPTVVLIGQPLANTNDLADQFWVQVDVDDRLLLTTSNAGVSTNAPTTGNFVTMSHYRHTLLNVWAVSPTPQFGFVFRSKQTAGTYETDILLSMTLIGYYVDANGMPMGRKAAA